MTPADTPVCSGRAWRARAGSSPCRNAGVVVRDGKPYCRIHDPDKTRARHAARQAKYDARKAQQGAILAEAQTLAARLGVDGHAEYAAFAHPASYVRSLAIPFEHVEQLLRELGR